MYSNPGKFFSLFWNGHSAVILFFVLSGFVLSLPFFKGEYKFDYSRYLVKRICRIYIPYLIIIMLAIISKILLESKIGTIQ